LPTLPPRPRRAALPPRACQPMRRPPRYFARRKSAGSKISPPASACRYAREAPHAQMPRQQPSTSPRRLKKQYAPRRCANLARTRIPNAAVPCAEGRRRPQRLRSPPAKYNGRQAARHGRSVINEDTEVCVVPEDFMLPRRRREHTHVTRRCRAAEEFHAAHLRAACSLRR